MQDDNVKFIVVFFVALGLFYFLMRFITDWRKDELIETKEKASAKKVYHPAAHSTKKLSSKKAAAPKKAVKKSTVKPKAAVATSAKKAVKTPAKKVASKKNVTKKVAPKKAATTTKKTVKTTTVKKSTAKSKSPTRKKAAPRKQDLTKIEGVGPKIAKLLNDDGIKTYKQLADSKKAELQAVLKKGGSRFVMHNPSSWARQANLADQDRWDDLKKLQDKL